MKNLWTRLTKNCFWNWKPMWYYHTGAGYTVVYEANVITGAQRETIL